MKKILLVMIIILFSAVSVFCGEFEDTLKKAEQGNASAQLNIAGMYFEGKGVKQNKQKAIYWLTKSAEQGNAEAQLYLGRGYSMEENEILPQDFEKAIYWFTKSAEQGNSDAQERLGAMYDLGQGVTEDPQKALYWYKQADAICSIGRSFFYGYDVPINMKKAGFWLDKAVENGCYADNYDLCSNYDSLGSVYYYGHGVQQNYEKALYFFKKVLTCSQKSADSYFYLGEIFYNGFGVTKNTRQAIFYYLEALYWNSLEGVEGYDKSLAKAKLIKILDNVDTSQLISIKDWLLLGVELGYDFANTLGWIYDTDKDYKKALYWYLKEAEKGNTNVQNRIGEFYCFGKEGVPQDHRKAVHWFTKAAEQGNAYAQYYLASMYYGGKGITQSFKLAYVWASLAAAQGNESSIKNRDLTAKKLSPLQLSEAQDLAAQIQKKIDNPTKSQSQESSIANTEKKVNGSGTGFIITRDGYVLTCHHVIKGAAKIEIAVEGKTYPATLVRDDPNNDLALLKINGSFPAIGFSSDRSAKMGQAVFTIGYPNPGLQGVSAKFTEGTINSLTGFQDDIRLYQISIPVQPGNSGGALLDENGNILGVVVAMLNAKTTFKITGSLPQNVNYAVKSIYAQALLDTLPEVVGKLPSPAKNKSDAIVNAEKSTVMVICYD